MATITKLTFPGQAGLDWETGEPTPDHSYASVQL